MKSLSETTSEEKQEKNFTNLLTLARNTNNPKKAKKELRSFIHTSFEYVNSFLDRKSSRFLDLEENINFLMVHKDDMYSDVLILDGERLIKKVLSFLNIKGDYSRKNIYSKLQELLSIKKESTLKRKFPELYDLYLLEISTHNFIEHLLKPYKNNKEELIKKAAEFGKYKGESVEFVLDSLEITDVQSFCITYEKIILELFRNARDIIHYFDNHPLDIFNTEYFDSSTEMLERDIIMRFTSEIKRDIPLEEKQKYINYLTSYFDYKIRINSISDDSWFEGYYNDFIDILLKNPTLKLTSYEKEFFDDDEIDSCLSELSQNEKWNRYGDKTKEKAANAMYNTIQVIRNEKKKEQEKEKIINYFSSKKRFFDNLGCYECMEGTDVFDGLIAYIYENGKVVLIKYFDKKDDGKYYISNDQKVYLMNIENLCVITNLSCKEGIKTKLFDKYIYAGDLEKEITHVIGDTKKTK